MGRGDIHGRDMTTGHGMALVQGDLMAVPVERIGRGQAADPGTDDGDLHDAATRARASSARCIPPTASAAIFRNAPPANGSSRRSQPVRRMSAM